MKVEVHQAFHTLAHVQFDSLLCVETKSKKGVSYKNSQPGQGADHIFSENCTCTCKVKTTTNNLLEDQEFKVLIYIYN